MNAVTPPVPLTSLLSETFDVSQITKEDLDMGVISESGKLAFLLHNVFTPTECANLIKTSEEAGYSEALVHVGGGQQLLMKGYRDGSRVMIDDCEFVRCLFERISAYLPATFNNQQLLEINERLRFLRYDKADQFKPHCDASYGRPDYSARTLITLQIYLNEDFRGGETTFLQRRNTTGKSLPVVPKTGMILVFEHNILHEGSVVKEGRKYTIRTDVLYKMEQ
ncbi:hypothetical protein Bhyg_14114 [Pseudolycoriella hygida]|uniref:Fe2OG dioxygenase domain-containing protein n=1 Tax=Pseudolycoriella hygida TaxID=35572 RepID=A0A9Q0RX39_9DIPT|nr:hypothetical protein Bhyg_14114 [Pseudolycoriella hygida]